MTILHHFNRLFERIFEFFLGITFLIIVLMLCGNVIARYGFGTSLFWAAELTNYVVIWITFIGSAICIKYGFHLSVDVLLMYSKGILKLILVYFGIVASLIFAILITWLGFQQVFSVMRITQITPAMRIPMYVPYLAIPAGGIFMIFEFLELMLKLRTGK